MRPRLLRGHRDPEVPQCLIAYATVGSGSSQPQACCAAYAAVGFGCLGDTGVQPGAAAVHLDYGFLARCQVCHPLVALAAASRVQFECRGLPNPLQCRGVKGHEVQLFRRSDRVA
jgi:hypothetical protein